MGAFPENSRAGIEAALACGVDGIEIDVRATRDHRIVLLHDRSLRRTAGLRRNIDRVDFARLAPLTLAGEPAGERLIPLEEALAMCAGRTRLVIDVKQQGIAGLLEAMLHVYRDRTESWVWTHDPVIARECIDVLGSLAPVSLIVRPQEASQWSSDVGLMLARTAGLSGLLFEHPDVDASLVERAREAGLSLHCGRTNEPEDIARVFQAAPDSMCSDFPERAMGVHLPAAEAAPVIG